MFYNDIEMIVVLAFPGGFLNATVVISFINTRVVQYKMRIKWLELFPC